MRLRPQKKKEQALSLVQAGEENTLIDDDSTLVGLPLVTVQLPIFNEMYVAERLIDSIR